MNILIIITIILIVLYLISFANLLWAPILKPQVKGIKDPELISILIPARNEEHNIVKCLESVLQQDYPLKEIIVLDDFSSDNTFELAKSFSNRGIKAIKGKDLPAGWIGKNWACSQLSKEATGNYLLFIDADVYLNPNTLSSAYNELVKSDLALLSVFPTQALKSFGEYLVVPLMNWILLNFLPLVLVYKLKIESFVAANGQFMFWNKKYYDLLGGHESVKDKVVEDMELARKCKKEKLKVKTFLGGELVFCKMYNSFGDAVKGFSKNFYAGFNMHPVLFIILITGLLVIFIYPIVMLPNTSFALVAVGLIILSRAFVSVISKQNILFNILFHPIQMLLMYLIGILSVIKKEFNLLEWKERKLLK
jgi:chlorobactene glucosyltransferase